MKTQSPLRPQHPIQRRANIHAAILLLVMGCMSAPLFLAKAWADSPWFTGYLNSSNNYRIYAFTDWDTSLFGAGIQPDSNCLGILAPNYRVDGHVVLKADGTGNAVVVESTGSWATSSGFTLGSILPVSFFHSMWFNSPSIVPTSDTRADKNSQFLNILADPVSTSPTDLQLSIAPAVAVTWQSSVNHLYQVEWSADLTNASWYFLGTSVPGTGDKITVYDSTTAAKRFYRIITLQ